MKTGIYKISSKSCKRLYIGSAINIRYRWNRHLLDLKENRHHSILLQRHFNKYGIDDLSFEILEECSKEELLIREQFHLDNLESYFNICKIAGSAYGIKRSEEFKKRISEITKGKNNPTYGMLRTSEWRKKISDANKGKPNKNKGKKINFSEENLEKMRELGRNRKFSKETRDKIRQKAIGRKKSDETKKKISKSHIGKVSYTKSVIQLTKEENYIKTFLSIKEAAESIGIKPCMISNCLRGGTKTTGGFKWKYL